MGCPRTNQKRCARKDPAAGAQFGARDYKVYTFTMFQSVLVKLRISLSCLRFFFNQKKIRTNCFFGVTGVGPFFRPPASAPNS